ncbi:hypothetical protein Tco_0752953, partial [Tanacetum coccineum]
EEEEEEWGLGLLYNLTTVVFNPTLVPSTKLLLSTEDAYGVGVGKGTSSSMQFKGALEMQLVVQRQVHEQVEETMEQSRHLEYAVNFWYYKHGLLQMKIGYYPYVGVFEIGITLGLESELRTARWSMILSRLSTVVELIQKLLQVSSIQNRKVLGSRSVAKKVELKAYTCDINRDDGPEPILQDPIALVSRTVRKVIGIEDREETRYKAKLEDRARREEELFTRAPPSSVENKKLKHMHESRFRVFGEGSFGTQKGCTGPVPLDFKPLANRKSQLIDIRVNCNICSHAGCPTFSIVTLRSEPTTLDIKGWIQKNTVWDLGLCLYISSCLGFAASAGFGYSFYIGSNRVIKAMKIIFCIRTFPEYSLPMPVSWRGSPT